MSGTVALGIKIGATLAGGFKSAFSSANSEIKKLNDGVRKTTNSLGAMYKEQAKRNKESGGFGLGGAAGVVGAAYAFAQPIKQAIEFETAMLGVAKQVEGARDAGGNLTPVYTGMRKEIQMLGREIPIATNELAAMVEAGARMGVAKEDLIGFTRNAAIMASAFDLPAAELADNMGKIANLYKIPIKALGEFGDAINYLDDNAISKGGDIINVVQRIGGTAATLKMTAKDAAALGSTFLSLGSSAEIAATASNAVMRELAIAEMQPKHFKEGLQAIGMSAKQVQADMSKNATGTILKVLDALNKVDDKQRLMVTTQLFGKEYGDDVAKLASNVGEYRRQLELANGEAAKGSMGKEFSARLQTTRAQMELMSNRVQEVGVAFGNIFLPKVNAVLEPLARLAAWSGDVIEKYPIVGDTVGTLALGLGTYAVAVVGATAAQWALNGAVAFNPFGIIAAGAVLGAKLIYDNWGPISEWIGENVFKPIEDKANALKGVIESIGKAWEWAKGIGSAVSDFFSAPSRASMKPVGATGSGLGSTGAGTGAGNTPTKAGFMGPVPAKPLPTMNLAGAAAAPQVTNVTNAPINVYQQPGENIQDLAKRVSAELARSQAADHRRALHD